jgi:hypothetical protein
VLCKLIDAKRYAPLFGREQKKGSGNRERYEVNWPDLQELKKLLDSFRAHPRESSTNFSRIEIGFRAIADVVKELAVKFPNETQDAPETTQRIAVNAAIAIRAGFDKLLEEEKLGKAFRETDTAPPFYKYDEGKR